MKHGLQTVQLSVNYPTRNHQRLKVLDRLNLDIQAGEFFSIIGPSGCGKTTLLQALDGLVPYQGQVKTYGRMAMVFQKPQLLPWKTVLDNALFGIGCQGKVAPRDRDNAIQLLARMKLSQHIEDYPYQLSEGMKQRVNLARALLVNPDVLLLDEPFSALDMMIRQQLHDDLLALWQERQFTVVLVSHSLDEVAYLSDRVAVFSDKPVSKFDCIHIDLPRPRRVDAHSTVLWLAEVERLHTSMLRPFPPNVEQEILESHSPKWFTK